MLIQDVQDLNDLNLYVERKLADHDIELTLPKKLEFLRGAKKALDEAQGLSWHSNQHHVLNLVNAEIARIRALEYTHPTLF